MNIHHINNSSACSITSTNTNNNAQAKTIIFGGGKHHIEIDHISSGSIICFGEGNIIVKGNDRLSDRNIKSYDYDAKDFYTLAVTTGNGNIYLEQSDNKEKLTIESYTKPEANSCHLNVLSEDDDVTVKLPSSRETMPMLNLDVVNGNIITVGGYRLKAGGAITTTNGNINLKLDNSSVYLRSYTAINGNCRNTNPNVRSQGAPLTLKTTNGNISLS